MDEIKFFGGFTSSTEKYISPHIELNNNKSVPVQETKLVPEPEQKKTQIPKKKFKRIIKID
jgi:hypothetical protein